MSWGSDSGLARHRTRRERRGHVQPKYVGARLRPPDALLEVLQGWNEVGLSVDEAWCTLAPVLAPHSTRREASSGVISSRSRVVEPASEGLRRHR